jgi:uncharacterized protein DUF3455
VNEHASTFFAHVGNALPINQHGLRMNGTTFSRTIGMLALAIAAHGGAAKVVVRPIVPPQLDVAADQPLALQARATGFQIYTCAAGKDAAQFAWALKAPEADLFDGAGRKIGRHYAGPTWEAVDGSKVGAAVKARADAPDANAVPWLLLAATSNAGSGVLAHVASIQRLNTSGGTAPAQLCDDTHAGEERRVPYTATYYFYSTSP